MRFPLGLGRSAAPRGVARRLRTTAGTRRSSRLARLAPRPSAAAGMYEAGSSHSVSSSSPQNGFDEYQVFLRRHFQIQRIARHHPDGKPGGLDHRRVIRKPLQPAVDAPERGGEPLPPEDLRRLDEPEALAVKRGADPAARIHRLDGQRRWQAAGYRPVPLGRAHRLLNELGAHAWPSPVVDQHPASLRGQGGKPLRDRFGARSTPDARRQRLRDAMAPDQRFCAEALLLPHNQHDPPDGGAGLERSQRMREQRPVCERHEGFTDRGTKPCAGTRRRNDRRHAAHLNTPWRRVHSQ